MNGGQTDPGLNVAAYNGHHILSGVFSFGGMERAHGRRIGHRDGGATFGLLLEPIEQRIVLDVSLRFSGCVVCRRSRVFRNRTSMTFG